MEDEPLWDFGMDIWRMIFLGIILSFGNKTRTEECYDNQYPIKTKDPNF